MKRAAITLAAGAVVAAVSTACGTAGSSSTVPPAYTAIAEHQVTVHGGIVDTYLPIGAGTGYAAGDSRTNNLITVKCYAGDLSVPDAQADLSTVNHPVYGTQNGVTWGCADIA